MSKSRQKYRHSHNLPFEKLGASGFLRPLRPDRVAVRCGDTPLGPTHKPVKHYFTVFGRFIHFWLPCRSTGSDCCLLRDAARCKALGERRFGPHHLEISKSRASSDTMLRLLPAIMAQRSELYCEGSTPRPEAIAIAISDATPGDLE